MLEGIAMLGEEWMFLEPSRWNNRRYQNVFNWDTIVRKRSKDLMEQIFQFVRDFWVLNQIHIIITHCIAICRLLSRGWTSLCELFIVCQLITVKREMPIKHIKHRYTKAPDIINTSIDTFISQLKIFRRMNSIIMIGEVIAETRVWIWGNTNQWS